MRIQVIRCLSSAAEKDGMTFSPLCEPRAIDDFDVNIIDLAAESMWTYRLDTIGMVDSQQDLVTVQQMVKNKKRAIVVYVLPQNIRYVYDTRYSGGNMKKNKALKDLLDGMQRHAIAAVVPTKAAMPQIIYEKTKTSISGCQFDADFYFLNPLKIITKSDKSEKPTTVEIASQTYATTLAITKSSSELNHFLLSIFGQRDTPEAPSWMESVCFGDDAEQNTTIAACKEQIDELNNRISAAQAKLKENADIKSILYTNGEQLVSIVFRILEKLLNCDLSTFIDEKREDFLIKLPRCTFIGEIKGVTSNVKYEHISQLELHYRGYLDRLAETGEVETVKQLLIINPFRTKPLEQRDPVHTAQIELAIRNECLIIETRTLLRIYERFCVNRLTSQQCEEVFARRSGVIDLSDFDKPEDMEPYKV